MREFYTNVDIVYPLLKLNQTLYEGKRADISDDEWEAIRKLDDLYPEGWLVTSEEAVDAEYGVCELTGIEGHRQVLVVESVGG